MQSSERPNFARRIAWLAVVVVVLALGYSIGWFIIARELDSRARQALADLNRDGVNAECENLAVRGFPFRIGLWCDQIAFADRAKDAGVAAGAFRSAGQIYDPLRLVAELDGPAQLNLPEGQAFSLAWDTLRASVRLSRPLPSRISIEGREFGVALPTGALLASAKAFEAHFRPNGADVDLAADIGAFELGKMLIEGRALPALDGRADIGIDDGVALLTAGSPDLLGRTATIRTLSLSLGGEASLKLSGTISVGEDGLLDAQLTVEFVNPSRIATVLADAFPEAGGTITAGFAGLAQTREVPSLPLTIVDGSASLAFLPLGQIPPLAAR